jgi:hypothetical protein
MTFDEFTGTTADRTPPPHLPPALLALWHDRKGNWEEAHRVAQDVAGPEGAWVHAYLHRREGDPGNAAYWYRRAGVPAASGALDAEWEEIATALLKGIPHP